MFRRSSIEQGRAVGTHNSVTVFAANLRGVAYQSSTQPLYSHNKEISARLQKDLGNRYLMAALVSWRCRDKENMLLQPSRAGPPLPTGAKLNGYNGNQLCLCWVQKGHILRAVQLFSSAPFLTEHAQWVTKFDHVIHFQIAVVHRRSLWIAVSARTPVCR